MTRTTTISDLKAAVRVLNQMVAAEPGKAGSYVLQGAYGGYQLQRFLMVNDHLATEAVFSGYRPKRELLDLIHAYRAGISAGMAAVFPPAPV